MTPLYALMVGICMGGEPMGISARDCIQRWEQIGQPMTLTDCTAAREYAQKHMNPVTRGPLKCTRQR